MKISNQLAPKFASTLLSRIALGVGVSATAIAIFSALVPQEAAFAQLAPDNQSNQAPQDFISPQNERDSFTGTTSGNGFNVFELMHRAQTQGSISADDFANEQGANIDKAVADFRRQQQQLLRSNQQPSSPNSVATPQSQSPANSVTNPQ